MALAIDRGEGTGLGLAVLAHVILFGLLTVGFLATPNPKKLEPTPIEISLTDEVGLKSEAPVINREAPAPRLAEVPAPPEPTTPPPVERAEPEPVAKPKPAPPKAQPQPAPKPQPKPPAPKSNPAPAKAPPSTTTKPVKQTGRLDGILKGLTDQPSKGKATTPPAAVAGPDVRSSIFGAIRRQVKPHWRAPTGADVDKLVTKVEVRLNRDGSLAAAPRFVDQDGQTASNAPQQQLHRERAINAIKLAAPFKGLPEEYYDAWKGFVLSFDRRL
ncbi:cell envelope biogenesis protein TolA [Sphingomonas koreensis]